MQCYENVWAELRTSCIVLFRESLWSLKREPSHTPNTGHETKRTFKVKLQTIKKTHTNNGDKETVKEQGTNPMEDTFRERLRALNPQEITISNCGFIHQLKGNNSRTRKIKGKNSNSVSSCCRTVTTK